MADKPISHKEMVDSAVTQIIRAFGKGEDLHGACWSIVTSSANWGAKCQKLRDAKDEKTRKRAKRKTT